MGTQILGQFRPSLTYRWDTGTLSWVIWDGSLTTGGLTIGKVDQGAPAASGAAPWFVTSGFGLVAFDHVAYTSGATTDTYVFKTGGSGGPTVATITISYTDATKTVPTTFIKT